ncbi:oxidoreductase, partial [Pseudomonas sp. GP01-A6]
TLSTGQNVTGEGAGSELIWGNTTKQAFFRVVNAKNIVISGIKFTGGYSAIIIDPISDGSVDDVGLKNCTLDGQLIGLLGGRQYALDPTGSKYCSNIWIEACDLRNIVVHGMVATNCYRPRATSNN